eukprot:NODE_199_length_15263_cov_0.256331.p1 type:complete len:878 gc:universal NODE_199_length_15263_cov_0.256331:1704-4337(+)
MTISQIDSFLLEFKPNKQKQDQINEMISRISNLFCKMECDMSTAKVLGCDYVTFDSDYKGTVAEELECMFIKPTGLQLIGSWSYNTSIIYNGLCTLDFAVEMPSQLVQDKDDTLFRYVIKRNYYLSLFCSEFSKLLEVPISIMKSNLLWCGSCVIEPLSIRLMFTISIPNSLSSSRLSPSKNNIRCGQIPYEKLPPTPNYNALLSIECNSTQVASLLSAYSSSSVFQDAVRVLKLFVFKKKLNLSSTSVTYLCHQSFDQSNIQSSTALVKSVLKSLSSSFVVSDKYAKLYYKTCCFDSISINRFEYLIQESQFALTVIDMDPLSLFHELKSWDHIIQFNVPKYLPSFYNLQSSIDIFDYNLFLKHSLERLISKACAFIDIIYIEVVNDKLHISIQNKKTPSSMLKGPTIQSDDANSFKMLWGANCQQRKFKDGSVNICVEFDEGEPSKILTKLLKVHFHDIKDGVAMDTYSTNLKSMESLVSGNGTASQTETVHDTALITSLKQLDLPLQITHVHYINMSYYALQLETSMSWPDNLIVMQSTKLLYLIRITKLLPNRYKCKLVDNSYIKRLNPFGMHQQLHIIDTVTNKTYKMFLLVDREYALLKMEEKMLNNSISSMRNGIIEYPDLLLPSHVNQTKANITLLKRKAGEYCPFDISMLVNDAKVATEYINQIILHNRDVKRCVNQYPLFLHSLKLTKHIYSQQGTLSMVKSNNIIDFNCGNCNYIERYIERMMISVFVHSYPYANAPGSINSAICRTVYKINNDIGSFYSFEEDYKIIKNGNRMVKTDLDMNGTWFLPYKMQSGVLKTMFKELTKASASKSKKAILEVENVVEYERLLNHIYPSVYVQTNKDNKVFKIAFKEENNDNVIRLANLIR